jgi:hypothetical protein
MIFFGKDLGAFEGESKYDLLAVAVARTIEVETKFAAPNVVPDLGVTQFGDGLVRRAEGKKNVYIFHDWYDAYRNKVRKYDKAIFLGNFAHPELEKSVTLDSYPVSTPISRPEDPKGQILICGEYEDHCHDWIVDHVKTFLSEKYMKLRIACPYGGVNEGDIGYWKMRNALVSLVVNESDITDSPFASVELLGEYMASSNHILHCGGHRGMVHSMAVSTGKCCSYTGDDSYRPSTIYEINSLLLPFSR